MGARPSNRMSVEQYRALTKATKYRNTKCDWQGSKFDSALERDRFIILDADQREGKISDLRRQVKFVLIPSQTVDGKLVERECSYIADFVYKVQGQIVVEDTKSKATRTPEYIIKRKLMLYVHGIIIHEIERENLNEQAYDHRKPDQRP